MSTPNEVWWHECFCLLNLRSLLIYSLSLFFFFFSVFPMFTDFHLAVMFPNLSMLVLHDYSWTVQFESCRIRDCDLWRSIYYILNMHGGCCLVSSWLSFSTFSLLLMYAFGGVNSVNTIFMVFISLALSLYEVVGLHAHVYLFIVVVF